MNHRTTRAPRGIAWIVFTAAGACAPSQPPVSTCDDPMGCDDAGAPDVTTDRVTPVADTPRVDVGVVNPMGLVSIALSPDMPLVDIVDAARPTVMFRVTGTQRDGRTRTVTTGVRFSIQDDTLGAVDESTGVFVPTGVGGSTVVRVATIDGSGLTAMTTLRVRVRVTVTSAGVRPADIATLDGAAPTAMTSTDPTVDYPLPDAVMPRNVFPPEIQWTQHHANAAATDVWRVQLTRPDATLTGYLTAAGMFRQMWQPPEDVWRNFAATDVGQPITMRVSVLSRGVARQSAARTFRTVDGVIGGSVYYWSPPRSRLSRVDVDRARAVDFLPNPGSSCIGCHSVSRNGQRLAGFLEGDGAEDVALYDLTRDLTASPAPTVARVRTSVRRCTSFNQDGTRLVSGDCGANPTSRPFSIVDAMTGRDLTITGNAGDGFDPEWSPDGRLIAFTTRSNDLAITAVTSPEHFGASRVIHMASAVPGRRVDWHPTFSPDSSWIAFQNGDTRRTGVATGGLSGIAGALWMISRDGGSAVRLDRANGGSTTNDTYRPVFSPFNSGGYFWLLFTSTRDYGNTLAGTRSVKQIWVTAVRSRPDGTRDPSEVAYYLNGQERQTVLSPYWTPPPCRPNGSRCGVGADCCSGECDPDSTGSPMCVPPRAACRARAETCGSDGDCCRGLMCVGGICDLPPPG